jgi:hypothetical protein
MAQPIIRLEIVYHAGLYVDGELQETYSSSLPTKTSRLEKIRFTVDRQMQPWFTDGERFLHPEQVGEELFEKVVEFFKSAIKRPTFIT